MSIALRAEFAGTPRPGSFVVQTDAPHELGRKGGRVMRGIASLALFATAFSSLALSQAAAAAPSEDWLSARMGSCLYKRYPARVQDFLRAASIADADSEYDRLANEKSCFERVVGEKVFSPSDWPLPMHLMRGALAEQALREQRLQARALPNLPVKQEPYTRPWFAATGRNDAINDMAACVADTDPAGIVELITSQPGAYEEGAAMARLKPSLTACLVTGMRMESDTKPVRAALADALYQRVQNPALSSAQAGEAAK